MPKIPTISERPKLLDLFCGVGGCSMGYYLAGFDVTGVDINPQPNYPFKFIQADALEISLGGFDCIHASPPCQRYSVATIGAGTEMNHPDLVDPIRQRLIHLNKPYVIENVPNAPLIYPRSLCGTMFKGLRVIRHRLFETNFWFRNLYCHYHPRVYISKRLTPDIDPYTGFVTVVGHMCPSLNAAKSAMGIHWAKNMKEVVEGIPPPYTQYIGKYLRDQCKGLRDYSHYNPSFLRD